VNLKDVFLYLLWVFGNECAKKTTPRFFNDLRGTVIIQTIFSSTISITIGQFGMYLRRSANGGMPLVFRDGQTNTVTIKKAATFENTATFLLLLN